SRPPITIAEVSFQQFYKMYQFSAGMTATATLREEELREVYGKQVVVVNPTRNSRLIRRPDLVYRTRRAQLDGLVDEVAEANANGRPVLVGCLSPADAEDVAVRLEARNISAALLEAKNHAREADIVARAGEVGAVTVSARLAGRGTHISLGPGARELGGLLVL